MRLRKIYLSWAFIDEVFMNNRGYDHKGREVGEFFRVASALDNAPLNDYLNNGYETLQEFRASLLRLLDNWGGRVGECVSVRHEHLLLLFHDTPGGMPDSAWIPEYLLTRESDDFVYRESISPEERELDEAFGFD